MWYAPSRTLSKFTPYQMKGIVMKTLPSWKAVSAMRASRDWADAPSFQLAMKVE